MTKNSKPKYVLKKMLGKAGYLLYRENIKKFIAAIDQKTLVYKGKFTALDVLEETDLEFKERPSVFRAYLVHGFLHLKYLTRQNIVKVDRSLKVNQYFVSDDCIPNARIGPDIDYDEFFEKNISEYRQRGEQIIQSAESGTLFSFEAMMNELNPPYATVPVMRRKYHSSLVGIFNNAVRSGLLKRRATSARKAMYERTRFKGVP